MEKSDKKTEIKRYMNLLAALINFKKVPKNKLDIQYEFNENEGRYGFYLSIDKKNHKVDVIEGKSSDPYFAISTDIDTLKQIAGGYISGKDAAVQKKFSLKGSLLAFILQYKKIFSGRTDWQVDKDTIFTASKIDKIKNVLILSASPRGKKGATHLLVEHLQAGMEKAGANVSTVILKDADIKPCAGCFNCWINEEGHCIYHGKDDFFPLFEKMSQSDLVVWATPIYFYHCSTILKTFIDRMFILVNPTVVKLDNSCMAHPMNYRIPPYQMMLATAGYPDDKSFLSFKNNLKVMEKFKPGFKTIAELLRSSSLALLRDDLPNRKKDEILQSFESAGVEIIRNKKISGRTKKTAEQQLSSFPINISAVNASAQMIKEEKFIPFVRNIEN